MGATSTISYLLSAVPPLVGALIGATAALMGVRWQINADRKQKKEESLLQARRDIYAEVMGVLSYSFLKGKNLKEAASDSEFRTMVVVHTNECFNRAKIIASTKLLRRLDELGDLEMKYWNTPNGPARTILAPKRRELVEEVKKIIREDLGITD